MGLASLFHKSPDFSARNVVTFFNKRDFIFFRFHRYLFNKSKQGTKSETTYDKTNVRIGEIGPRFTLRLECLYNGVSFLGSGEYEFKRHTRAKLEKNRKHLY